MAAQRKSIVPTKIKDSSLHKYYQLTEHLGKGAFASVNKAICRLSKKEFAIKSFNNLKIKQAGLSKVIYNELGVLKMLDHPNVVQMKELFKTE